MGDQVSSGFRTVRGYRLANLPESRLTPALEDYLEMTYRLCLRDGYARVGELSKLLNVRPSSASKMIAKLSELDYLKRDRYEIIQLTESGRKTGKYLLRRHNTVETFLKLIGSTNLLMETELVEHSLSPSTVTNLEILLKFFEQNPASREKFSSYKKKAVKILASTRPAKQRV